MRFKDLREDEALHGYPPDFTLPAWPQRLQRADPAGARVARGALLGNCFHHWIVAFLLAELAWQRRAIIRPLDINQLVSNRAQLEPRAGLSLLTAADAPRHSAQQPSVQDMARWLLQQQSA